MTTRLTKKLSSGNQTTSNLKNPVENSWIIMIKDSLFENNSFRIITLPHPAHGTPSKYVLDGKNKNIFEIVTFNEPYRSWFIGETVKSDGSFMLVTPINPVFIVLPRLREQCKDRAMPINDLLSEKGYNEITGFICGLDNIADLKGSLELCAYKYNEEKTLKWLEEKVRKLSKLIRKKNVHVTSGVSSATFISSTLNNDDIDEEFYLKYAFGILSDYLQDDLVELLESKFDFKPELIETVGTKRKSNCNNSNDVKRIKCETLAEDIQSMDCSSTEVKKQKPLTAKEKARQKAASGTKTISSFFVKK
ncbi:unnamed protein product [Leptosia nina]|uniref:Ribonuclease H2 subunit B n=1 Tax=Leptosia nina TaxID=320188 RepID=A0AAV1JHG8_9NEOP